MLAAAIMSAAATAENSPVTTDLSKRLVQNFMDYAGLSELTPNVDLAEDEKKEPRVMAFGYETADSSDNGLIGYELGLNFDLGWSYELPLYNQDENLIFRQRGAVYGGGRNYVSFTLYVIKFTLFGDLWLGKATAENYLSYDIVNYQNFCMAGQWLVDLMRASLLFQIDVNECVWGLVGSITSDTQDCDWATYYINQPFLDFKLLDGFGGELYNSCENPIPEYDS